MSNEPNGEALLSFIERIERLIEERKALDQDIAEVYAEVKSHGYDRKIVKLLVKERAEEPAERSERETLLDLYREALARARTREARP
jgi:uncharacterized protein (UPF0335 family)